MIKGLRAKTILFGVIIGLLVLVAGLNCGKEEVETKTTIPEPTYLIRPE
jgi:hypothetical protein